MKNLKPYSKCSKTFFDEVLDTKENSLEDPQYLDRIELLKPDIKDSYNINKFNIDIKIYQPHESFKKNNER